MEKTQSLTEFAGQAGISIGYASQLLSENPDKRRTPTVEMALLIYERTGRMFGILEGASRKEALTVLNMARRTGLIANG